MAIFDTKAPFRGPKLQFGQPMGYQRAAEEAATGTGQPNGPINQTGTFAAQPTMRQPGVVFRAPWANGSYGQPNAYFYNGHNNSDNGADGDWVLLPVAYNQGADTRPGEQAMRQAVRRAYDMMERGQATDFAHALQYWLANMASDWHRAGRGYGLGFDPSQFAMTAYGEAYDPNKRYYLGVGSAAPTTTGLNGTQPPATAAPPPTQAAPPTQPAAPPATQPPPAAGQPGTPTPGGPRSLANMTAADKAYLAENPELALTLALREQGRDLSGPSMLNRFIKDRFTSQLEGRIAAADAASQGGHLDQIDRIIQDFVAQLTSPGGGPSLFQENRRLGQEALRGGMDYINNLADQGQAMQYVRQLQGLIQSGSNPMVQQALADMLRRDFESWYLYDFDRGGVDVNPFLTWWQSRPYYKFFQF